MFGVPARVGLCSTNLTKEVYNNIIDEEDLQKIIAENIEHSSVGENIATNVSAITECEFAVSESTNDVVCMSDDNNTEESGSACCDALAIENSNIIVDESEFENAVCFECKNVCCQVFYCESCFEPLHDECKKISDATILCTLCFSQIKITQERREAVDCTKEQADRMLKVSDRKFGKVAAGKTVRVPKPTVDRSKGDALNILAMVLDVTDEGLYRLGTRNGILKGLYARSQFSVCDEELINAAEIPKNQVASLRTISNVQSLSGGQGMTKCICTKGCTTKLCSCKKAGRLCNSRCHGSNPCKNK